MNIEPTHILGIGSDGFVKFTIVLRTL